MKLNVYQQNAKDCGAACLLSIIKYYGGNNSFENVRYLTKCDNGGITALNLIESSKKLGFNSKGIRCNVDDLKNITFPAICHVTINNVYNHYVIIENIKRDSIHIFDPAYGKKKYNRAEFEKIWNNIVIELVPNRILDKLNYDYTYFFKNLVKKNLLLYIKIIIVSFISLILTLISNYYFKILLDGYKLLFVLMSFSFVVITKEITDHIRNIFIINLEKNIDKTITEDTHSKLLSLPNYYFNSRNTGDIISKIYDLDYIKQLFVKIPIILFINSILLAISTIILIKINKELFFIFLLMCILYFTVMILFNKKSRDMININQENNIVNNKILIENVKSINTIKNLNIIDYRNNIYKSNYELYLEHKRKYERLYNLENLIKNIILFVGINIILYKGVIYTNKGIMELGDLILFESLMMYFIESLKYICELNPLLKNGMNAIKRINEIFLIENKHCSKRDIDRFEIKINGLYFSYDNYKFVLKNLNLKIKDKEKLVIIGSSGCGKSTLLKLINKTYEVDDGKIFINNVDINKFDITQYVSYISQEEHLFNDSLYNNLVLDKDISIDTLNEIIHLTGLDVIMKYKNLNINSIIEEDGNNFSKGERQRIILSRILLRNNNILILDEALNGIEEDEEYKILQRVLKRFNNKTIIYVTHRLKCLKLFNNILDFKKIKEGTCRKYLIKN